MRYSILKARWFARLAVFPGLWGAVLYAEYAGYLIPRIAFALGLLLCASSLIIRLSPCVPGGRRFTPTLPAPLGGQCASSNYTRAGGRLTIHIATRCALVLTAIVAIAVISVAADIPNIIQQAAWNPIGVGNDVGEPPCETSDKPPISNARGQVVVVRQTYCHGDWGAAQNFVFVRNRDQSNNTATLAFRYDPSDDKPPDVRWIGPARLEVQTGTLMRVTMQRKSIDGISIHYNLGEQVFTPEITWWQRIQF